MSTEQPRTSSTIASLSIDPSRKRSTPSGRKFRWKRWVFGAVVVIGIAAIALAPRPLQVNVTTVVSTTPSAQFVLLNASGFVVAQRRASVGSKASGRVTELLVREGTVLKQGDLIARLDARDVQAGLAAARANIGTAQAGLTQAQAEYNNASIELKRARDLLAQNFISKSVVDQAAAREQRAQAAVAQAKATVEQARANEANARVSVDFTEIRAPFDGVVLNKNANIGDNVTPFSSAADSKGAVVTMADLSTLEVEADVSESSLSKVKIGQPVEITLDALPDARFIGSVVSQVPTVDRAKATVTTKVRFNQLDPRILPEMSAKVSFLSQAIDVSAQKSMLAVNPAAVVQRDGNNVVLRLASLNKDGKDDKDAAQTVQAIPVQVGQKVNDMVQITGEVKSGDKLILKPEAKVVPGAKVKVQVKGDR